tara:strand:- start:564 stop:812 length:249 start_codon:yes stop_codon:yes gene_type:complete
VGRVTLDLSTAGDNANQRTNVHRTPRSSIRCYGFLNIPWSDFLAKPGAENPEKTTYNYMFLLRLKKQGATNYLDNHLTIPRK